MKFVSLLSLSALALPTAAFAQDAADIVTTTAANTPSYGLMFALLGAGIATIIACIGSAIGVSMVGQAGAGLLTEKPGLGGKVITLTVLPGSQGLYGMVISLLFVFNYSSILSGETPVTTAQGLMLMMIFLPVAFTCVTSAIYQAKVCVAGLQMLARDEKLAGRVITLAALVETYALLGFLISFFLLNGVRASIIGGA
jgi:V/A-type H+/Na+-transporting ATPase subunit K